ncbi:restriction endonuclease subunit S [Kitasatospora terrestris]|uniref:Type I restriction modification DNA specificity domain-containing protein n=1 Tax=Kitasatospora terrestris TaxID=258051 RepID=A0ABP9DTL7_9ACTN
MSVETSVAPSWIRLADCGTIRTGPSGQLVGSAERTDSGIPVLRPQNIGIDHRVVEEPLVHVSPATADRLGPYRLQPGDILCTRTGRLGRPALVTERQSGWIFSGNLFRIRPDVEGVDTEYLLQFLASPSAERWMQTRARQGTGIPSITLGDLSDLPVPLLPVAAQRRIVSVLNAVDEKISTHQQIVRTSEQLREVLSRELFDDQD